MYETNPLLNILKSCPQTYDDVKKYFTEVAQMLMNNYVISKSKIEYEIVEIEFYLFNSNHPDVIVYPRNCVAGQWFFLQSGVDLTFATTNEQFGGILIRGLREIGGERKQIFGPQNCVNLLWDKFNAFEAIESEIPTIIPANIPPNSRVGSPSIVPCKRWIPVKKDPIKSSCKIAEWITRVGGAGYHFDKDPKKITELVFESEYRFIKEEAININDNVWKHYNAKTKKV